MKITKFQIIFFIGISIPFQTLACSCRGDKNIKEDFKESDIVFLGKYEEVVNKNESIKYAIFNVIDSWKGANQEKITIKQGGGVGCMKYFDPITIGTFYIIFANELSSPNKNTEVIYWSSTCGGTDRIDTENNTIEYLNDIIK